jgi:hypothetical protein
MRRARRVVEALAVVGPRFPPLAVVVGDLHGDFGIDPAHKIMLPPVARTCVEDRKDQLAEPRCHGLPIVLYASFAYKKQDLRRVYNNNQQRVRDSFGLIQQPATDSSLVWAYCLDGCHYYPYHPSESHFLGLHGTGDRMGRGGHGGRSVVRRLS